MVTEKTCPRCQQTLPAASFWRSRTISDGLQGYCKVCSRAYEVARYGPGKPKPGRQKRYLREQYGITVDERAAMEIAQSGCCAICGKVPRVRLDVDHCHTTGIVRGLLCHRCNTAIGLLGEDPNVMLAAATYVLQNADVLAKAGESNG